MSGLEIRFARANDERLARLAPAHWREKAASKRFERDRRLELVAGGLLVDMLGSAASAKPLAIRETAAGKPFLADFPEIHFSISHSDEIVMCVVADHPVGCDVERDVLLDDDMRREIGSVSAWTLREAAFKCGEKAGRPHPVGAPAGYCAAICEASAD